MLYEDLDQLREENEARIQIVRRVAYLCGVNMGKQSFIRNLANGLSVFLIILASTSVVGSVFFIHEHFSSILKITESLCLGLETTISTVKLLLFIILQKRFHKMIRSVVECKLLNEVIVLDNDIRFNRRLRQEAKDAIEESWRKSAIQVRFYFVTVLAIMSFYFFYAFLTNSYNHIIGTPNYVNIFPFKTMYPGFEEAKNHSPYYELFMLIDSSAVYVAGMIAISFDGMYVYLTYHAAALFEVLNKMIVFSTSHEVPSTIRIAYIRECVTYYNKVIRYCDEINSLFSIINLAQLIISLAVLGVGLFQASVGLENDTMQFIKMILYNSAAVSELTIFCFGGQNLTSESEKVPISWYSCNWYDESRELKTLVYMMIIRSRKPYYLSAWKFTTMTLPTFMAIAKTSGSYFMLLRNVSQGKRQ